MCQLKSNFLCKFCPHEKKCEEERANLTEEQHKKLEEMGE